MRMKLVRENKIIEGKFVAFVHDETNWDMFIQRNNSVVILKFT